MRQLISRILRKVGVAPSLNQRLTNEGLLRIGRGTYGPINIERYEGSDAKVEIGRYCSISKGVRFVTGGIHPPEWVSTYPFRVKFGKPNAYRDGLPRSKGPITIGNDVWIGTDALILSGVKVGDGAIIAARSVVNRDIPPYAIAGGVPARILSWRFEQSVIDKVLAIAWWEWPEKQIEDSISLLSSGDVELFISNFDNDGD